MNRYFMNCTQITGSLTVHRVKANMEIDCQINSSLKLLLQMLRTKFIILMTFFFINTVNTETCSGFSGQRNSSSIFVKKTVWRNSAFVLVVSNLTWIMYGNRHSCNMCGRMNQIFYVVSVV